MFANELIQLYQLFSKSAKDTRHEFPFELLSCLPKSLREYMENINFEEFHSESEETLEEEKEE